MTRWMLVSMRSISSAARRGWIDLSWDVATTPQSSGAFPDRASETLRCIHRDLISANSFAVSTEAESGLEVSP